MRESTIRRFAFRTIAIVSFAFAFMMAMPAAAQSSEGSAIVAQHRVDVNSAGIDELDSIPGIGPALAQRIIEERRVRPFRRPQDLVRVKGIGETTAQRIRPYIRTESRADKDR